MDLAQFHDTVFRIPFFQRGRSLTATILFRISNFFGLSITEETLLVEMRIWCIKIGNVKASSSQW
jgi:hypothetical protein